MPDVHGLERLGVRDLAESTNLVRIRFGLVRVLELVRRKKMTACGIPTSVTGEERKGKVGWLSDIGRLRLQRTCLLCGLGCWADGLGYGWLAVVLPRISGR